MPVSFMLQQSGAASIINSAPGLAARFDADQGITASGGFASQWSDLSGNARHLLQATGANQPIHLIYLGTKRAWLPGVANNWVSTPNAAANRITGDLAIACCTSLADWTPSEDKFLLSKYVLTGNQRSYAFGVEVTTGKLTYTWSADGTAFTTVKSSVSPTVSDGAELYIGVSHDVDNGAGGNDAKFWTSPDSVTWTQLGTTQTTAGTTSIFAGSGIIDIGSVNGGGINNVSGYITYAKLFSGIPPIFGGSGSASPVMECRPDRDWTTGATFVSATTGETYTITSTGVKPAQIVDRPSLLFDGTAHKMATAAFTLNQPSTHYYVMRQITWTSGDVLADGLSANTGALAQTTSTPRVSINAGAAAAENTGLTLAAWKVVCVVINGASSSIQVGTAAETTGNAGAGNMGGLTLGADGAGANYGNGQYSEDLHYNVAHDAATRANIIRALMSKHGVT